MKSKAILLTILTLLIPVASYALTGDEVFSKLKERLTSVTTMKGIVSITFHTGEFYTGNFQYMPPGQIYINFASPQGKTIASNGRRLWVYDAETDVCGVQELYAEDEEKDKELDEEEKKKKEMMVKGGIENIFNYYQPVLISDESKGYILELRNEKRKIQTISINLDKSGLLNKAQFNEKDESYFIIQLSNVKFDEKIIPGLFDFNVPANAQVIKNPLDIR